MTEDDTVSRRRVGSAARLDRLIIHQAGPFPGAAPDPSLSDQCVTYRLRRFVDLAVHALADAVLSDCPSGGADGRRAFPEALRW